jgi:4-amino-4-deoxychorismate lyase
MDTAATDLRHTDLASADEIFITNSLLGICPVRRYEKQALAAGAVTRRLADRLANWKHSTPETFKP